MGHGSLLQEHTEEDGADSILRRNPRCILCTLTVLAAVTLASGLAFAGHNARSSHLDERDPVVAALVEEASVRVAEAPREASTHGELGLVYEANNLWREAAAAYEIASGLDPSEPLWRLHWAIALSEEGETARGIEMLRAVASESPQLAAAHHRLGLALIETGEVPAAREHFSKLIALKPDAPEGYVGSAGTRL